MAKSYDQFFEDLGFLESSKDYSEENTLGFIGKYQMGEGALIDTGYYTKDGTDKNDWKGKWTGKDGVNSKQNFKDNHSAQEWAVREYARQNWRTINRLGLASYIGKKVNNIEITISGMLAGAHLLGVGGLREFLKTGLDDDDDYGTKISKYVSVLAGYDTPFSAPISQQPPIPQPKPDNLDVPAEQHQSLLSPEDKEELIEEMKNWIVSITKERFDKYLGTK